MSLSSVAGAAAKMHTHLDNQLAQYRLPLGDEQVEMNRLIGQPLRLRNCQYGSFQRFGHGAAAGRGGIVSAPSTRISATGVTSSLV